MALPANVGTGTVTGTLMDTDGVPLAGVEAVFTPSVGKFLNASSDTVIVAASKSAQTDASGSFSVDLMSTDDPDNNPVNWTYLVSFRGVRIDSFSITVPEGSVQDLADITPVSASPGNAIVRGVGIPDPSGASDGDVVVWDAALGEAVWKPVAGVSPTSLNDLSDVDTSGSLDGQALVYDSVTTSWAPGTVATGSVDWTEVQNKPTTFTPSAHTHAISDVNDLNTTLAAKANSSSLSDVATTGQYADLLSPPTALSDFSGAVAYSQLPAGVTITLWYDEVAGQWSARSSARSDLPFQWVSKTDVGEPAQAVVGSDMLIRGLAV